jgi:hypothetical protein
MDHEQNLQLITALLSCTIITDSRTFQVTKTRYVGISKFALRRSGKYIDIYVRQCCDASYIQYIVYSARALCIVTTGIE